MKSGIRFTLQLLAIVISIYAIHKALFVALDIQTESFKYSLEKSYLIFFSFTATILFILFKVRQKNLDVVGYTFLLLTTIKMVVCYITSNSFLNQPNTNKPIEKWNFFTLFFIFLIVETIFTIRLLNKKDSEL
jgi:glucose uptake protein GlcU